MNTHMNRILIVSIVILIFGFGGTAAALAGSLKDFECPGNSIPMSKAFMPKNSTHKATWHYCQQPNGKANGLTKIEYTVFKEGEVPSNYTIIGNYNPQGKRVGWWTIRNNSTNAVIGQCQYADGKLNQGDPGLCVENEEGWRNLPNFNR